MLGGWSLEERTPYTFYKNISSRLDKFLYHLENKQWLLTFSYKHFQIHFPTDSLSYSLSHLNIISLFIIYSFFNNYTSSNIFFIQYLIIIIEKKIWRMNSSPSDLMSYCSWAKKNSGYRQSIGDYFYGASLYYRNFYVFSYTVRDALRSFHNKATREKLGFKNSIKE